MAKPHNFKEVPMSKKLGKGGLWTRDWHCKSCDTVIRYDARLTEYEVNNKMMMTANFPCIPPVYKKN